MNNFLTIKTGIPSIENKFKQLARDAKVYCSIDYMPDGKVNSGDYEIHFKINDLQKLKNAISFIDYEDIRTLFENNLIEYYLLTQVS